MPAMLPILIPFMLPIPISTMVRKWIHRRNCGRHTHPGSKRPAGKTAAIFRLREDGVCRLVLRLHDDVVGFGYAHPEFIHRDRLYIVAIGLHHRHLQTGNPNIEEGHG